LVVEGRDERGRVAGRAGRNGKEVNENGKKK